MASIPLLSKGVTVGALNIVSTTRRIITEEEKTTLLSIGREIGNTIERMTAEDKVKKTAKNSRFFRLTGMGILHYIKSN